MRIILLMAWAILMHFVARWWGTASRKLGIPEWIAYGLNVGVLVLGLLIITLFTRPLV